LWRTAEVALWLGIASALFLTLVGFVFPLTREGASAYRHVGDYLYSGNGIPFVASPLLLLWALRRLQDERGGKMVSVGFWLAAWSLVLLMPLLGASTVAGKELQWGPTYILLTLGSIVGIGLFAAGSQRLGLIPRSALWFWVVSWTVGGLVGPTGSQLLLAAAYGVLLVHVRKRAREDSNL
jgi:hypothetical protein